jgi:hypothetical protein
VALAALVAVLLVGQVLIWRLSRESYCGCFGRTTPIGIGSIARTGVCGAVAAGLLLAAPH